MNMIPLVNKPYLNGYVLKEQHLSLEFRYFYASKVSFKGVLDLSKKVLWISADQRAAKLQAVRVRGLE